MENIVVTREENVSDYVIGLFQDTRLQKVGALLFKKICSKMTTCIKRLADNRAMQIAFSRFLQNDKTTITEMENSFSEKTNQNCLNKKHVLCLQDTVEVAFPMQEIKKEEFGPTGRKTAKGFFAHPGVIVDANTKDILGLNSIKTWIRSDKKKTPHHKRPLEEKESINWVETAQAAKRNITNAEMITVIGDRESDIYELFDRVPDNRTHLLVRSNYDRKLENGYLLSEFLSKIKVAGAYEIELSAITNIRKPRKAIINIKFSTVIIRRPENPLLKEAKRSIELTCVEAIETGNIPEGEEPIYWRILTTHKVTNLEEAKQIVIWYTWRWIIEQIFRTMKKKGFDIEESQIENTEVLLKIFTLSIAAAIVVLSLVAARDGKTNRPASDIFNEKELMFLTLALSKVEGKTQKQKNPFINFSLSWASWIIARFGGWKGYASESPPGPITMYGGLEIFYSRFEGWLWAQ